MAELNDSQSGDTSIETVRLIRDNAEAVEVIPQYVTPRALAALFQLKMESIYLKEVGGPHAFFPDHLCRSFQLTREVGRGIKTLFVEGVPVEQFASSNSDNATVGNFSSAPVAVELPNRPVFNSGGQTTKLCTSSKPGKSGTTVINLKILQARVIFSSSGSRPELEKIGQMFTQINDSNANVSHITNVVTGKWGPGYVLVTADCLKIEDSDGTRGLQFWKVSSRKFFAVEGNELFGKGKGKGIKRRRCALEDGGGSEDEQATPTTQEILNELQSLKVIVESVFDIVESLKGHIESILELKKGMKIPIGLAVSLQSTFKCNICQSLIKPPLLITRCCKNILGCDKCITSLYSGEGGSTKRCPMCRAERAFSETSKINGFDDLLRKVQPLLEENDSDSEEELQQYY